MQIVRTFVPRLYAFKYPNEKSNELARLLSLWVEPLFLEEFFELHEDDLAYFGLNIDRAIEETIKAANALSDRLLALATNEETPLSSLFRNLDDSEYKVIELSKQKGKQRWLRIYAIKIDRNCYVITGGAIKLTRTMQDRPHTQQELAKLNKCRDYLQSEGIFDLDSFNELDF